MQYLQVSGVMDLPQLNDSWKCKKVKMCKLGHTCRQLIITFAPGVFSVQLSPPFPPQKKKEEEKKTVSDGRKRTLSEREDFNSCSPSSNSTETRE